LLLLLDHRARRILRPGR